MRRLVLLLAGLPTTALAAEGQWLPEQVPSLRPRLEAMGLKLPVESLWDRGPGLLQAVPNYSGCSSGFVSDEGLVVTNHHCAYPALQGQSTPDRDLLEEGFLARTRTEELSARGRGELDVLLEIRDVTDQIRPAVDGADGDRARLEVSETRKNELAIACEAEHPGQRCQVYDHGFGSGYRLIRTFRILDVRLVYAPPSAVGAYGGEVDNWSWPRHAGDFTLLRAYVAPDGSAAPHSEANVPFRPPAHLQVSAQGVQPSDLVVVAGYPGRTDRYWPAVEVQRYVDQVFPAVVQLYGDWVALLEREAGADPELQLKVAAVKKGLANRLKNARGMLAGLERMDLVRSKRRFEEALNREVLQEAQALSDQARRSFDRDFLLENLQRGPNLLAVALDAARLARAQSTPDVERDPRYADRNRDALWRQQERRLRDASLTVDLPWMLDVLDRLADLDLLADGWRQDRSRLRAKVRRALQRTSLQNEAEAQKLFMEPDPDRIADSSDPLVRLALSLAERAEQAEAEARSIQGGWLRVGPTYLKAVAAARDGPMYPDANRTLRLSFAKVRGYRVEDGLWAEPQTRLAGQVAKHTGEAPFVLPESVRSVAGSAARSAYRDPGLGDVPVCFLSDADTTGGNSGSPVLDAQGRLVGLNFDRVWENIAGDFAYNPAWSRNISVDVRYLLWTLTDVNPAPHLLKEMMK